jgi:catechol 2,3-dioxygenase-like lactoylglutathione lyase family enzyme
MSLSDKQVIPAVAVSDMAKAREFYEGKLGLSNGEEKPDGGVRYPCGGGSALHVYPSPDNAGRSPATEAAFRVDDIEGAVDELAANGVTFEQYDIGPIKTNEKGIAQLGDAFGAWFKDPDGNIFGLEQE